MSTMKHLLLTMALLAGGFVDARSLGVEESEPVSMDLAAETYQTVVLGTEVAVEMYPIFAPSGDEAQLLVNGEIVRTSTTNAVVQWAAPGVGVHVLTHRVAKEGVPQGEDFVVTNEVWAEEITLSNADVPLKDLLPTAYTNVIGVTFSDEVTSIVDGFFADCSSVTNVVWPEGYFAGDLVDLDPATLPPQILETLAPDDNGLLLYNGWVLGCEDRTVETLVLPEGVVGIARGAFAGMENLTTVSLPVSLQHISSLAFEGCSGLSALIVPNSVASLGAEVFNGATNLVSVYYLGNAPEVEPTTFAGTVLALTNYVVRGSTGWTGDVTSTDLPEMWPAENARGLAVWSDEAIAVSFAGAGGDPATNVVLQIPGMTYLLPEEAPSRSGYAFIGWFFEDQRVSATDALVQEAPHTLIARWRALPFEITFDVQGGSPLETSLWVDCDAQIGELPRPEKADAAFGGWFDIAGNLVTSQTVMPDHDLLLTAHWGEPVPLMIAGQEEPVALVAAGEPYGDRLVSLEPEPRGVGYEFVGWATTESGEELVAFGDLVPAGGATLYPIWSWEPFALWPRDGLFSGAAARTFNGYIWNGSKTVGTVIVKTKKWVITKTWNKAKTRVLKATTNTVVSATMKVGSKSYSYTGGKISGRTGLVRSLKCTKNKTALSLQLGTKGLQGTYGSYQIFGALAGAGSAYRRGWSMSLGEESVTGRLLIKISSTGVAKIAGTTASGAKISASANVLQGDGCLLIPILSGSKTTLVRIDADGTVTQIGSTIGDIVVAGATTRPVFADWTPSENTMVGVAYLARPSVTELGRPLTFSATGLPAGLVINKSSGAVSGVPTQAGTFVTRIKATSSYNVNWYTYLTVTNMIAALPKWATGSFAGLAEGTEQKGGANLSVSSIGKVSGKIALGGTNWTLSASSYARLSTTVGETNLILRGRASYQRKSSTGKVLGSYYLPYDFAVQPPTSVSNWLNSAIVGGVGLTSEGTTNAFDFVVGRSLWKDTGAVGKLLSRLRSAYWWINAEGQGEELTLKLAVNSTTRARTGFVTVTGTLASPDENYPKAVRKLSLSVPILYEEDPETGAFRPVVIVYTPPATVSISVKSGKTTKTVKVRHAAFWARIELDSL